MISHSRILDAMANSKIQESIDSKNLDGSFLWEEVKWFHVLTNVHETGKKLREVVF